ncbi:MAG: NAD(P)/FAD-dependent oxidoreductase [Chloroflexota bacterium]
MTIQYVIAGNGAAGIAAVEAIRSVDRESPVRVVSAEPGPAYSRVLLHHMVAGEIEEGDMVIRDLSFYHRMGLSLVHSTVEGVDVAAQRVYLSHGQVLPYDRLLVATGARSSKPPVPGIDHPRVHCLWTAADAHALTALARSCHSAAVVGAGFVGIQAVDGLTRRGVHITLVDVAERPLPLLLDSAAGRLVSEHLRRRGVDVRMSTSAVSVERGTDGGTVVDLSDGAVIEADLVVVATGARPNVEFMESAGVRMARGIVVDAGMLTSAPNVYGAGDVTITRDVVTGLPVNCAIWPEAVEQGRIAGLNMAGRHIAYAGSLRVNVTSALGLLVGSVGVSEESETIVSRVNRDDRRGIYRRLFFREGALVGAILIGDVSDLGILGSLIRVGTDLSSRMERVVASPISYPHLFGLMRHPN